MAVLVAVLGVLGPLTAVAKADCPGGVCPAKPNWQPIAPSANVLPAAHCRIAVADGSMGSGTLVDRNEQAGLVLTCAHLFDGTTAGIVVAFPSGQRYAARLLDRDRAHDLAAVVIRRPNAVPVEVNADDPSGLLTACGYGPDGRFRGFRGQIVGRASPCGAVYPSLTMRGAARPGDSGGGVLNAQGQLVGVVWGQQDGETYFNCGVPLQCFLDRVLGRGRRSGVRGQGASVAVSDPQRSAPSCPCNPAAVDARLTDIEGRVEGVANSLAEYAKRSDLPLLPVVDQRQFARRDELQQGIEGVADRFASVDQRLQSVRQRIESIAASKTGLFQGLSLGKLVAGALGLSGPLAAAVVVAGGLAGRRVKSRVESRESRDTHAPALDPRLSTLDSPRPIAVDSPPLPQRAVPETHYVPYETDAFARAHQWASEQVVRKYPGAVETISALDSLIKQQLNATERG